MGNRTPMRMPESTVSFDHNPGVIPVVFWTEAAGRGYREHASFHWPTSTRGLPDDLAEIVLSRHDRQGGVEAVLEIDATPSLARVQIENGNIFGQVAAADRETVEEALALVGEWWPESAAAEDEVPMTFWSYSQHGPRSISRRIAVPTWADVRGNYGGQASEALDRMMTEFEPSHGGQLILWQGIPGTGKTWALRALASEWRGWADFHYITDPEVFFGDKADYMLDVLLDESDEYPIKVTFKVDGDEADAASSPRWRVLLLEDTGEILAADAKEKTGQALSRLLNVVDGLIGQGLRILVLVTTNEELKKLHPAVSRPGRCAARIEFAALPGTRASEWAASKGIEGIGGHKTIAELYALLEEREGHHVEVPVGFVQ